MATTTETTGENFAAPYRGPIDAIKTCIMKSFDFRGRASRSEFWWFAVLPIVAYFYVFIPILTVVAIPIVNQFFAVLLLATTIPLLAAGSRRLHDVGKSEWYLLLYSFQVGFGFFWGAGVALAAAGISVGIHTVVGIIIQKIAQLLFDVDFSYKSYMERDDATQWLLGFLLWLLLTFLPTWILVHLWRKPGEPRKNKYDGRKLSLAYQIAMPMTIIVSAWITVIPGFFLIAHIKGGTWG